MFEEQSGQNVLLFLPVKSTEFYVASRGQEHEGNVRGGTFVQGIGNI
jgi:hypothetical protein